MGVLPENGVERDASISIRSKQAAVYLIIQSGDDNRYKNMKLASLPLASQNWI